MIRMFIAFSLALIATPLAAQTIVKTDRQWDGTEGQYQAYAAPWCAQFYDKSLVEGRDFVNTITYQAGDLASAKNVQFTWRWPDVTQRKCGVYAYDHVAWGNYDGGAVRSPVAPRQVSSIKDFTLAYQVDYAADLKMFNGLGEFYLTKVAGDANTKAVEIGWFYNAPPETIAWAKTGKQLGTFTDRYGRAWSVAANKGGAAGFYITFIPTGGKLFSGAFDGSGALTFLTAAGQIKPEWWVNGAAIGVEPLGWIGTALVRKFGVTVR